ncbi:MAG: hypothetical protein ACYS99_16480 [Planctomycetota bacterium]|jgi:hypothetical protein
MPRVSAPLTLTLILLLAASAPAAGVSGHLNDLEGAMVARSEELALETGRDAKKASRGLTRGLRVLARPSTGTHYAREVKAATRLGKILEKKLEDEAGLLSLLDGAVDAYRKDLEAARDALAAELAKPLAKGRKGLERTLTKANKALGDGKVAPTRAKELRKLAKAAKLLLDYIGQDGGNGGGGREPPPDVTGETATWVISDVAVPPASEGLDLDGDGTPDNVLGGLGDITALIDPDLDINQTIADRLTEGDSVLLVQMWGIDDWSDDPLVLSGLMNGLDTDGIPGDNFSGTEVFDVTGSVDENGYPLLYTAASLSSGGQYEVEYSGAALEVAGFVLPAGTPVKVKGTAEPSSNSGTIGFGIPMSLVFQLIEELGFEINIVIEILLNSAADLDVDGDGTNESMSGALVFDSVPAGTE